MKSSVSQVLNHKLILWCLIVFVSSISVFCLTEGIDHGLLSIYDLEPEIVYGTLFLAAISPSIIKFLSIALAIFSLITGIFYLPKKTLHIRNLWYHRSDCTEHKFLKITSYVLCTLYLGLLGLSIWLQNYWLALFFLSLMITSLFYTIWFYSILEHSNKNQQ